ncbi:MAG: ribokinase [Spirochaetota bacterium]|nr:MAG: ribokinase [Spirochaetota bacterium]
MKGKPRIVVIGSANIDLIMRVQRVPNPGETVHSGNFSQAAGGKGANQAVACARLGADVEFVGRVGEDPFGETVIKSLKNEGIKTKHLIHDPDHHTGIVVILVDSVGQNAMIPDYGANLKLTPEDINSAEEAIKNADIMLLQHEVEESVNLRALTLARQHSVPVVLNPAPRVPQTMDSLKRAYLITPNLVEVIALAELAGASISTEGSHIDQAEMAARTLLGIGIENIVVTLGSEGSLYISSEDKCYFKALEVIPIDCTAAGDSFTAALAYCIAKGQSIPGAIPFASSAAAITVTRPGAQPSLPTMNEIMDFIKSNNVKTDTKH